MKVSKTSKCTLLWLLLLSSAVCAQDKPLRLNVSGEITIDEGGNVSAYKIETPVSDTVRSLIDRTVKKWTFEPVLHEGSAVYAKCGMELEVVAIPIKEGLQLRVDKANFETGRRARQMMPPAYPTDAMRRGFSAEMLLAVRVDGDGDVREAFVVQSKLKTGRKRTGNSRVSETFETAALAAAKKWKFEPVDISSGEKADATLIVPVDFMLGYSALTASGWKPDETEERRLIPWLPASEQDYDAAGLKSGDMLGLGSSPVRLRTPLSTL